MADRFDRLIKIVETLGEMPDDELRDALPYLASLGEEMLNDRLRLKFEARQAEIRINKERRVAERLARKAAA